MKISRVSVHRYCLPLRATWQTAAGGLCERQGWLLRLATNHNAFGYGDCAVLPSSGTESATAAQGALRALLPRLLGRSAQDALATLECADHCVTPAARCAVESALLDLLAQEAGLPLATYLCDPRPAAMPPGPPPAVRLNAALGGLGLSRDEEILAACSEGFQVLKFKLGVTAIEHEIDRLRQIAALLPSGVALRLDANRAWRFDDALRFLHACADLPVEMIEEPLTAPDLAQLQRLQAGTSISIGLDESTAHFSLATLLQRRTVHRLVIKPARAGGLLPALALAQRATNGGLDCVVTSSLDSACGLRAAAHLAAALDNRLAHGLATCHWFTRDTGATPSIVDAELRLGHSTGLGFLPDIERLFSPIDE